MEYKQIKNLPKVDLHVHLGGCFARSDLWTLARKYRRDLAREQFDAVFAFHDFAGFSAAWKFKNSLVRTYEDFSFLLDGVADYLKRENYVYWEPAVALFEFAPLDPAKLLDIAAKKLDESGIRYSFIMDLIRGDGAAELGRQYDFYHSLAKDYAIRGVGLAGNEEKHGLSRELIPVFEKAKADGYGLTVHANETGGSFANIQSAIQDFRADRVGHASCMNFLLARILLEKDGKYDAHIEFVPSALAAWDIRDGGKWSKEAKSYLRVDDGAYPEYNFSVGSDDPGMFGKSLSDVLFALDCRDGEYRQIMRMANAASFAPPEIKRAMALQIEQ